MRERFRIVLKSAREAIATPDAMAASALASIRTSAPGGGEPSGARI
jgi:hypothetical protein